MFVRCLRGYRRLMWVICPDVSNAIWPFDQPLVHSAFETLRQITHIRRCYLRRHLTFVPAEAFALIKWYIRDWGKQWKNVRKTVFLNRTNWCKLKMDISKTVILFGYSQLVQAYYLKKTSPPSDSPFIENSPHFPIVFLYLDRQIFFFEFLSLTLLDLYVCKFSRLKYLTILKREWVNQWVRPIIVFSWREIFKYMTTPGVSKTTRQNSIIVNNYHFTQTRGTKRKR